MIDPAKLTAENGFTEGCVVEISDEDDIVVEYFYRENVDVDSYHGNDFRYDFRCESLRLRPITGPMAIWNFADDGVQKIVSYPEGPLFVREKSSDEYWDNFKKNVRGCVVLDKPFWARSEK